MPKVTGPLFSVGAQGTLGEVLTFQKGMKGHRVGKVPRHRDAQSQAQLDHRDKFLAARDAWLALSEEEKAEYTAKGNLAQMTGWNLFLREYILTPPPPDVMEFEATTSDGYLGPTGKAEYSDAHDAATGNVYDATNYLVLRNGWVDPNYFLDRSALFFPSSGLPDDCIILSAYIELHSLGDPPPFDMEIVVVRGADLNDPLVTADYGELLDETVSRGSQWTSAWNWVSWGYAKIHLNALGLAEISKTGMTKFGLRLQREIAATVPTEDEKAMFYSANKGAGYRPKLAVTYS